MDFSLCSTATTTFPYNATADASTTPLCSDSLPLGRLILGLYGHLVPLTVSNFKSLCSPSSPSTYKNTLVHKIFPGEFFLAGRQGRREKAEVRPPLELPRNTETVDSRAFMLTHSRAGVVSLCLSENDDDDDIKLDPNYRNVEFLITTGPGPCPQLDSKNIVFGTVLEGKSLCVFKVLLQSCSFHVQTLKCVFPSWVHVRFSQNSNFKWEIECQCSNSEFRNELFWFDQHVHCLVLDQVWCFDN
jgi:cyclophilin family peptidyl-prolyl cis-trans isomerase